MTVARAVRVRAHAKINLALRVGPPGADGYHELQTVFQTLDLHDTVVARPAPGPLTLECDDPHVPAGPDNLAWRAAESLWRQAGRRGGPRGAALEIRKRVPMQAGLGGGSSDAAAALVAMNALWGLGLGVSVLNRIGATLGADVPSFLVGGTSLGLGRGDDVYPLVDAAPFHVVLAFPPLGILTKDAYRWFDADGAGAGERVVSAGVVEVWPGRPLEIANDLAAPVVRRHPEIALLRATLRESGAVVSEMTGSGSTVFGLFTSLSAARRGAAAAAEADAWSLVTRFAPRRRGGAAVLSGP